VRLGLTKGSATLGSTGSSVWLPSVTSGLDLVLHAGQGVTLAGSDVATWADQSGAGNNFSHATLRPAFQASGGPGGAMPALYFSGTGELDAKRLTGPAFSGSSGEIFIIAKADTDPHAGGGGLQRFGPATPGGGHTPYVNNLHYLTFGTTVRKDTGVDPGNHANWFLVNWSSASGAFFARFNRTQYYTTATNTVGWHTSSTLGADQLSPGVWWNGHIAGVIKYNTVLSAPDRATVEADILAEFGV
jgi:hypothetical protein